MRGGVAEFRRCLWETLQRAGARVGEAIVVLGDGAEWIDQTVAELFVGALYAFPACGNCFVAQGKGTPGQPTGHCRHGF